MAGFGVATEVHVAHLAPLLSYFLPYLFLICPHLVCAQFLNGSEYGTADDYQTLNAFGLLFDQCFDSGQSFFWRHGDPSDGFN